jgi:hypothetical protein
LSRQAKPSAAPTKSLFRPHDSAKNISAMAAAPPKVAIDLKRRMSVEHIGNVDLPMSATMFPCASSPSSGRAQKLIIQLLRLRLRKD